MQSIIRRIWFWLLGFACAFIIIAVWFAGYAIQVNNNYTLAYYPENKEDGVVLYYNAYSGNRVVNIQNYSVIGSIIVGHYDKGYFIALPTGEIHTFRDRGLWLEECGAYNIQIYDNNLKVPSRFQEPTLVKYYIMLGGAFVIWLFALVIAICKKINGHC